MSGDARPDGENSGFTNRTVREVAHLGIGGHRLRVRLSNAYGAAPLEVGEVHVALRAQGSSIVPGSDRPLSFEGGRSVMIPAGAPMLSDPVDLDVVPGADIAVSIFFLNPLDR